MNNLSNTDWLNVVFQSLMRLKPIRNFFIDENNYQACTSVLVRRFGELVRKYFNAKNFKGQVSPHELLQAISKQSNKKFQIGNRADPLAFLAWFLDSLHRDLGGNKSKKGSIISKTFQGVVGIETYTPLTEDSSNSNNKTKNTSNEKYSISYEKKPFFYILLDLPPMPLFKDGQQEKFIPQIPLTELLNKFNNETEELLPSGGKKKYRIVKLPPYLIIAFRRFQENNFFVEKNATIVNFNNHLCVKQYLFPVDCDKAELSKLSPQRLKQKLRRLGGNTSGLITKEELIEEIIERFPHRRKWKTKYDLVANVCHDGEYDSGSNRVFIYHQNNRNWYELFLSQYSLKHTLYDVFLFKQVRNARFARTRKNAPTCSKRKKYLSFSFAAINSGYSRLFPLSLMTLFFALLQFFNDDFCSKFPEIVQNCCKNINIF
ncbi:SAP DNA-binding domain-containing protein [Reticulomyxa filosa]|uniref:SAP DNA-binding domain-containing protein n=1 Tax=Reticulomyxa filosa TaxID=46433 RepID=X6NBV8_RETFI|nr:SAP DNA-binding domain-containing protein [Reticulomyxa filosa]|eukprot:ETO23780.1 SAP DNA-binding domain-containing protein [Reticulomyxa filosa]